MPKCCVRGCGSKYNKKAPLISTEHLLISLHKLPKNEKLRRKWLESLGQENIDSSQEKTFVCSLHFEESCINKTLGIVRLQDNAIPTRLPQVNQEQFKKTTASTATSKDDVGDICMINPEQIQPGMSTMTNPDFKVIQKLKNKCTLQQKKIKRLSAKWRRQAKKLADFKNILQDLHKRNCINNAGTIMLEECFGPKDFLKRQLAKSRGLPLQRMYSAQIRKFALTLHFLSPAAYKFIRNSYDTCLPHTQTLSFG